MKIIRGLAAAALVVAAVAATPAVAVSAEPGGFVADDYPATLQGSQQGTLNVSLGTFQVVECSGMGFEGTLDEPLSPLATSEITDPSCEAGGSLAMTGCQLELHPETESADIGTAGCGPVKVTWPGCGSLSILPQEGISTSYENAGEGSVIVAIDDYLEYSVKGNVCHPSGTFSGLRLTVSFEITATDEDENSIGTSAYNGGLFLAGGSEEVEPYLAASKYPAQVVGERLQLGELEGEITLLERDTGEGTAKVSCEVVELGGGELTESSLNEFNLDATYSECEVDGGPVGHTEMSVEMESCYYQFSELEDATVGGGSEMEYATTVDVVCDEGDAITIAYGTLCTLEVPAQTLTTEEPTGTTNLFEEDGAVVTLLMTAAEVGYTSKNKNCQLLGFPKGTHEDGGLRSDMLLRAEY